LFHVTAIINIMQLLVSGYPTALWTQDLPHGRAPLLLVLQYIHDISDLAGIVVVQGPSSMSSCLALLVAVAAQAMIVAVMAKKVVSFPVNVHFLTNLIDIHSFLDRI